jgi:soluble lytic murein transglycosylase-like protein
LFARRSLVAVVGVISLVVGTNVAAAPGDERRGDEERKHKPLDVLERPERTLDRAIESHERREEKRERRLERRRERREQQASSSAAGVVASSPEAGVVAGVSSETLEAIAACESGGDPTAVSSDGTYRGKYQFDAGTWASVGGSGDPAAAPEAEQDYRASLLYQQAGTSPWPNCG